MPAGTPFARCAALVAGMLLVTALSGCGGGGGGGGAQSATATTTDPVALIEQACSRCHPAQRVSGTTKDRAGWTATVDRMRSHGAQLTDAQAAAIVDYLTKRDAGQ